ncbi:MAG TPA: hypothetical protein VN737_04125 [Bryobacteraceae bacterium]|nr:hypothetical protein [Bryobacteraceae bacterium]
MASLASILSGIRFTVNTSQDLEDSAGIWRPPQWARGIPAIAITATDPVTKAQTAYVFDAVIRAEHEQRTAVTLNPVQTGAAISDHAYTIPASLVLEIAMSDAMQSFTMGQWADGPSKSVSAYQKLISLQKQRLPLQVSTRLRSYSNMMITGVHAEEDHETASALKATVTFQEILTATVITADSSSSDSALPQTTNQTVVGQIQAQAVPQSVQAQNSTAGQSLPSIPGAGSWSSTSASQIQP